MFLEYDHAFLIDNAICLFEQKIFILGIHWTYHLKLNR